eukprot:TRINITY_DN60464_c0_g1_i1.p1 TRINITY_DN60464_c0_g1~~TRINITY_DN60464_c0_g1_i1.p1  ORF type:complete len:588 (-),score=86.27 TRINITY_DN60464_c0_g1_i1:60-1823(-)
MPSSTLEPQSKSAWEPNGPQCSRCHTSFTFFRRRHHCRYCGRLVCWWCSARGGMQFDTAKARICADCVDGRPSVLAPRGLRPVPKERVRKLPAASAHLAKQSADGNQAEHALQVWAEGGLPAHAEFLKRAFIPQIAYAAWFEGFATLEVQLMEAQGLAAGDHVAMGGSSDAYVVVDYDGQSYRTAHIAKSLEPQWKESVQLRIRCPWAPLRLRVYDMDFGKEDDLLGVCLVPGESLCRLVPGGPALTGWLRLKNEQVPGSSEPVTEQLGGIRICVSMKPLEVPPAGDVPRKTAAQTLYQERLYWAFLAQAGWDPRTCVDESEAYDPEVAFNLVSRIVDVIWTRLLLRYWQDIIRTLRWQNIWTSLRWFLAWAFLICYPKWLCFAETVFIAYRIWCQVELRRKTHPLHAMRSRSRLSKGLEESEGDADAPAPSVESSVESFARDPSRQLNGWAASALRMCLPAKHGDTVADLQPRLRRWANNLEMIEDLLWGRHMHSMLLVKVLVVAAVVQLWPIGARTWGLLWLILWFVYFTPVWSMLEGYFSWRKHIKNRKPAAVADIFEAGFGPCPAEWRSADSVKALAARNAEN